MTLLTAAQAAHELAVSPRWIRTHLRLFGEGVRRLPGRSGLEIRISLESVRRYQAGRATAVTGLTISEIKKRINSKHDQASA